MTSSDTRAARFVYRIAFQIPVDMQAVEETLLLAILAVGCLYGEAAIRLDAGYAIDADERVVVIDASNETGRAIARVFIGFCTREFGDDTFSLARVESPLPTRPTSAARQPCGAGA